MTDDELKLCKEAFEVWCKSQGFSTAKNTDGTYFNHHESRWEGYQAAWDAKPWVWVVEFKRVAP